MVEVVVQGQQQQVLIQDIMLALVFMEQEGEVLVAVVQAVNMDIRVVLGVVMQMVAVGQGQ